MKKGIILIAACTLVTVAAAWAANIPNALDKGAVRLGPMLAGAFEKYSGGGWPESRSVVAGGGGAAFWTQYDGSWFGYEARLGAVYVDSGGSRTYINWENEYNMYLIKGKFRPYITPAIGLGYVETRYGGDTRPVGALYFGVRLNSPVSPFHITFDGGYKYIDAWWHGIIRNRYFFGLTDSVALRVGIEFAADFDSWDSRSAGRLDVGPAFSF
jgi:hypothetical protein